ncbi:hypothetical protein ABH926_003194 [Catenulispora sp. GP43]|uniref:hypothetical protein n=1 Tax=Catenulispora sp. GP43 TaxID=3156263 RepID=UPI0035126E74
MAADPAQGCREEAESLRDLALGACDEPEFRRIADAARAVAARPDLGSVAAERELDRLSLALRGALIDRGHRYADPHFRSPEFGADRPLPSGGGVGFIYERGATAVGLEDRLAAATPAPPGWHADHVIFNSGMAAISCALQGYRSIVRPSAAAPLRVGVWASYYETDILFGLTKTEAFRLERLSDPVQAVAAGGLDVLYLEPVRYDWDLTPMDVDGFTRAWRTGAEDRPRVIVLDTTLSSCSWPTAEFLRAVGGDGPTLVVELRSALKLDQQGLELANAGVASIYSRDADPETGVPDARLYGQFLRVTRSVTGTALSMDAMAVLDHGFVFDPEWTRRHAGRVFGNNRRLAAATAGLDGIFARVGHPSLAPAGALRDAPFVMFQLAEDTRDNHAFLLGLIGAEVAGRGLPMAWGASFGFRAHRWETIFPQGSRKGLFKVAMGARSGPSADAAVALLHRLAGYPDFDRLRRDHPDVKPVALTPDGRPA